MKILVVGAGKMGVWLIESLCLDHDVAAFDTDLNRLKYLFNTTKLVSHEEITAFNPDMLINAVNLEKTITVFNEIIPLVNPECLLVDITSVKNGLRDFYMKSGRRFVSTHPMFGPTFANIKDLIGQNAIIISQSDDEGKSFFRNFFKGFNLNIFEYTFTEHDQTIAYSLSIPFASSIVFAACMKKQEAPGTTFKKHHEIACGVLSEDDYLLSEILFSPYTLDQIERISERLNYLKTIIGKKDFPKIKHFLDDLRDNIK
ncbi:MAG: prephenate dehydrogenase [Bacteroidales bacterium]|nr:prephenate dehydrogenase [Bacteroidales bacterium]